MRELTEYCNFGDSLDKALRDRIVGGINHESTQKKLLSERNLTYERAVEIAQGVETSDANLREMTTPLKPVTVKVTGYSLCVTFNCACARMILYGL